MAPPTRRPEPPTEPEASAAPESRLAVGHLAGAHGIRGEVRVRYGGDGPETLLEASEVWLGAKDATAPARRFAVDSARAGRPGEVLLRLAGVADREAAERLRGLRLEVAAEALPPLPEGEFYWHELIGCRVFDGDGGEVGLVREILETGAHDVLVVEAGDGRRHLVPTAAELVREIDPAAGRIVVELPPGLLEDE